MKEANRLHFGWYIVIFLAIGTIFSFVFGNIFGENEFGTLVAMGIGFAITYGIYKRIETGKSDFRGGLSMAAGILIMMLASGMAVLPFLIILAITDNAWKELFLIYAGGIGIILLLATVLSWATNKSPQGVIKEFWNKIIDW